MSFAFYMKTLQQHTWGRNHHAGVQRYIISKKMKEAQGVNYFSSTVISLGMNKVFSYLNSC